MKPVHALVVACATAACFSLPASAGELLSATFKSDNTFTPAFKALPSDATKPLFAVSGGSPQVQDGKLVLANGRITVGAVSDPSGQVPQSTAAARPAGVLDLSKPYKIIVKVAEANSVAAGKDNFFIYVNNSTTKQADSPVGSSSQLVKMPVGMLKAGDNVFPGTVGDANSFLQIRAESGAAVKIEAISIAAD